MKIITCKLHSRFPMLNSEKINSIVKKKSLKVYVTCYIKLYTCINKLCSSLVCVRVQAYAWIFIFPFPVKIYSSTAPQKLAIEAGKVLSIFRDFWWEIMATFQSVNLPRGLWNQNWSRSLDTSASLPHSIKKCDVSLLVDSCDIWSEQS